MAKLAFIAMFACGRLLCERTKCPGRFLGTIREDPRVSNSNRVHACDLSAFLHENFWVYSMDSSNRIFKFLAVLNFNRLFMEFQAVDCSPFIGKELQVLPCQLTWLANSPSQPHELFFVLHARLLMLQPFLGERQERERLQIDGLQINANTCFVSITLFNPMLGFHFYI